MDSTPIKHDNHDVENQDQESNGFVNIFIEKNQENMVAEDSVARNISDNQTHEEEDAVEKKVMVEQTETKANDEKQHEKQLITPHSQLPKPEAPPGLLQEEEKQKPQMQRSVSVPAVDVQSIGKFFRERSNSFSAALVKRISSFKENNSPDFSSKVTEINLSGLKVVVQVKNKDSESEFDSDKELNLKGKISFFSRSNCRDCGAVRCFFREKGLKFIEINIDVYPSREKELIQRTGSAMVPQIFFNEKLFGGLVALNSLRNCGELDNKLIEMLGKKCAPESAPKAPVYGFDDPEDVYGRMDVMIGVVRVLRHKLPIQDRLCKMKIVKNCFSGSEMVEVLIQHLDCGRKKATEIGKDLARRHFIHHIFGENDFEDGNHFYRFLEHEAFIPKCYNFWGSTNDCEPKPASTVGQKLTKIMSAALESYASEDRRHVDYTGISNSEEFRRYVNVAQDLQRCDILALSLDEKLSFFLNLYNAMVIHAVIRVGCPEGVIDRRSYFGDFQYIVGGRAYSLTAIKNGILRANRRQPYSLVKPFGHGDRRLEVALPKVNPLIHFGLCNATRSSPKVQFFSAQGIEVELRRAAREFLSEEGVEVDLENRNVHLTRMIKWYDADFGQEKEILKWIMGYLDATKAGLLSHLLSDGGHVNIVYQSYNWALNT